MSDFSRASGSTPSVACPRLDQRQRGLRAFLHHLAQLAGEDQPPRAGRARGLDEEDVAADRRPGESRGDAGHAAAHRDFGLEFARPEDGRKIVRAHVHLRGAALRDAHGNMAKDVADLALEIAHAGLARVVVDDQKQGRVADRALLRLEPGRRELARHQVAAGDLQLFGAGVAGQRDDLHAVAQRPRYGVEHVGRADEHHARRDRTAPPDNCRGRSSSVPDRALRAGPTPDRRESRRRRACRPRRASSRSCASRPCADSG